MKAGASLAGAALLSLAALTGCWLSSEVASSGGSGSESTNGNIVGRVAYPDGRPAAHVSVIVRSADYLRDTTRGGNVEVTPDAFTDEEGVFRLDSLTPAGYLVEVRDGKDSAALMAGRVVADSTTDLGGGTLRPVGVLEGVLSDSTGGAYVQIYGLEHVAACDSTGHFVFADLPGGAIQIKAVSPVPGQGFGAPDTIYINAGQKVQLTALEPESFAGEDYSQWPRSRKISLNAAAAGVREAVDGYPLLLRLDSSKFDFAAWDVKSVRFADRNGKRLPYEIERSDAKSARAEIWVRLDTLRADGQDDYITMFWGKSAVPDFSDGPGVFDAFAGVWHLQLPPPKETDARFADASPTRADGTGPGPWTSFHDIIGRSPFFLGDQSVDIPASAALRPAPAFSISGWARSKLPDAGAAAAHPGLNPAKDTTGRDILAMGDIYGLRIGADGSLYFFALRDTAFTGVDPAPDSAWSVCRTSGIDYRDDKWHHFAAVADGAFLRVYVDGAEKANAAMSGGPVYPFARDLSIGRSRARGGTTLFRYLDEVRLSPSAWSAARVKADYESQKPAAKLAEFK